MPDIRLIKHEVIPKCDSFEVRFAEGRPSSYFCWEDIPGRRLRQEMVDSETALKAAKTFTLAERSRFEE